MIRTNRHLFYSFAFLKTLAILFSFMAGALITKWFDESMAYLGSLLCAISTILVFSDSDFKNSLRLGWMRIVESLIGSVVGVLYFLLFDYSIVGMSITIFCLTLFCMFFSLPGNGRMATVVLIWIFIRAESTDMSPLINGLIRFIESVVGVGFGFLAAFLANKLNIKDTIDNSDT